MITTSNTVASPEECADICESQPLCKGFRYRVVDTICTTKKTSIKGGAAQDYDDNDIKDWYETDPMDDLFWMKLLPQRDYGCIWAESSGGARVSKRIDVEVCGTEEL